MCAFITKATKSKGALKAFDRAKSGLRINENGEAIYSQDDGKEHKMVSSSNGGCVQVKSLKDAIVQ